MRVFWLAIAVLAAVTVGLFLVPSDDEPRLDEMGTAINALDAAPAPSAEPVTEPEAAAPIEESGSDVTDLAAADADPVVGPQPAADPGPMPAAEDGSVVASRSDAATEADLEDPVIDVDALAETLLAEAEEDLPDPLDPASSRPIGPMPAIDDEAADETTGARSEDSGTGTGTGAGDAPATEASAGEAASFDDLAAAESPPVRRRDDGSMLVADRYVIRGSGTKDDPYVIGWDVLVSASRTYAPRQEKEVIPSWVRMLDGQWVTLAGYAIIPTWATQADEMLLMLNEWDGCCIGVPPTPYDGVEVRLAESFSMNSGHQQFNYGSVTGRLDVDPYLANGWLIGLYVLEDARADMSG